MLGTAFADWKNWHWELRCDLDLVQRYLVLVGLSWPAYLGLNCLPSSWGLWLNAGLFELCLGAGLMMVTARSALRHRVLGKMVLVTGADTGIGLQLAIRLHSLGFHVVAGCLLKDSDGAGAKQLEELQSDRMSVIQLDVTKQQDWKKTSDHLVQTGRPLWALVNNAGWSAIGDVEWIPADHFLKACDINLMGVVHGVQACLPLLRHSQGRVVTLSSPLGRRGLPGRSTDAMAKFAVQGFHDCLRYEMKRFNVKVSLLEPGHFRSASGDIELVRRQAEAMWNSASVSPEVRQAYGADEYFKRRMQKMEEYMQNGQEDFSKVIDSYTAALLDVFPQKRYQAMGLRSKWLSFVATHLPEMFYDCIVAEGGS